MHIHILGISGTFMAGLALLARANGHTVTGSDLNIYPPMSTQLEDQGIALTLGYDDYSMLDQVDKVIVGNVIKRGNPAMEYVMNHGIPYTSGPCWLADNILINKQVIAIAGTHGKTTTTSMLTWILECAGVHPSFLIGGIPENFGFSSRLTNTLYFVIEADEYDSAFFDKRSKFLHYHPHTLILNNLEYDHADIFPDLKTIVQQFHYLIRTVPSEGLIIHNAKESAIDDVLSLGVWTKTVSFNDEHSDWQTSLINPDGSAFTVFYENKKMCEVKWDLVGEHNVNNALAAIIAAYNVGITPTLSARAFATFKNVKRRLEKKGSVNNIVIYDDFAHHPTAIATTLKGLRAKIGKTSRMVAILEFGSYTMRTGVHKDAMQQALTAADLVICKTPADDFGVEVMLKSFTQPTFVFSDVDELISNMPSILQSGDHVVVMSNTAFGGIHQKLLDVMK